MPGLFLCVPAGLYHSSGYGVGGALPSLPRPHISGAPSPARATCHNGSTPVAGSLPE
jgi:hypothetical protein